MVVMVLVHDRLVMCCVVLAVFVGSNVGIVVGGVGAGVVLFMLVLIVCVMMRVVLFGVLVVMMRMVLMSVGVLFMLSVMLVCTLLSLMVVCVCCWCSYYLCWCHVC